MRRYSWIKVSASSCNKNFTKMSSSNTTIQSSIQNEVNTINFFIISWARFFNPIVVLFGIICNTLNIYVFTRSALKRNPCCMYFLSSSIAAFIYTVINLPLRTLQVGYNIDPTSYMLTFCKLKFFFTYTWRYKNLNKKWDYHCDLCCSIGH